MRAFQIYDGSASTSKRFQKKLIHHVQYRHNTRQREEIRVRLDQHPLNFIKLGCSSPPWLFRRIIETLAHGSENLEFHEGHRIQCYRQR